MYYGAGLLSTQDKWPPLIVNSLINAKKGRTKTSSNTASRSRSSKIHTPSQQTDKEDWDEIYSGSVKDEPDDSDRAQYAGMNSRAIARLLTAFTKLSFDVNISY